VSFTCGIIAVSLSLFACTPPPAATQPSTSSSQAETPPTTSPELFEPGPGGSPKPLTPEQIEEDKNRYDPEELLLQEGLANLLPEDQMPAAFGNLLESYEKRYVQDAYAWAVAITGSTMYVSSLWDSYRANPKPYGAEFAFVSKFLEGKKAEEWSQYTLRDPMRQKDLQAVSELVLIPETLPEGAVWVKPTLRQWQYDLIQAKVAGKDENEVPLFEFTIKASAVGGYTYQGKYYQFTVERTQALVLAESPDPTKKWHLVSWKVSPVVFSEAIETGEAPPGTIIPKPAPNEITEGTPIPDPNYPAF